MENITIRIIEKLFIVYFVSYFIIDIVLFIIFLITFRNDKKKYEIELNEADLYHKTSIIVPAYNEEISILNCINMLYKLDYPVFEIVIVNDGSTDNTLQTLHNSLNLISSNEKLTRDVKYINTADIRSVSKTADGKIILVDKVNGGKADSVNAGINYSQGEFVCTIDADSILDSSSLRKIVKPMIIDKRVFVTGGQLAVSNGTVIKDDVIVNFKMPDNIWVIWQITEYIKSFLVSRIGLSKIKSLLIMSGAFSLYRREDLLQVGGFLTSRNDHKYLKEFFSEKKDTVCEDMEIVIRLSRYYLENKKDGIVVYLPKPLCWTEVPDNSVNLFKQRARWHQGLAECLFMHSKMFFDPKYSTTGMLAFPYYFFLEFLAPLVKILALIFIVIVGILGVINGEWVLLMIIFITLTTALITSLTTVLIEIWSFKETVRNRDALRYNTAGDWIKLILYSIIGDFSYSFFKIFAQLKGTMDFLRKKGNWNKFERRGLDNVSTQTFHSNIKL